jgi:WD40 repeat protein
VRLIQSIPAHDGVVWITRFNTHGNLLATGGQDGVTRVWAVCSHSSYHHHPAPAKAMQSVPLATQPTTHTKAYTIKPSAADASDEEEAAEVNRTSAPALQSVPSIPLTVDNAQSGPPSLGAQSTAPTWVVNAETQPGQSQPSWGPPVLQSTPLYLLHGHTDDVLDLAWSAGNFLLTASVSGHEYACFQKFRLSQLPIYKCRHDASCLHVPGQCDMR